MKLVNCLVLVPFLRLNMSVHVSKAFLEACHVIYKTWVNTSYLATKYWLLFNFVQIVNQPTDTIWYYSLYCINVGSIVDVTMKTNTCTITITILLLFYIEKDSLSQWSVIQSVDHHCLHWRYTFCTHLLHRRRLWGKYNKQNRAAVGELEQHESNDTGRNRNSLSLSTAEDPGSSNGADADADADEFWYMWNLCNVIDAFIFTCTFTVFIWFRYYCGTEIHPFDFDKAGST